MDCDDPQNRSPRYGFNHATVIHQRYGFNHTTVTHQTLPTGIFNTKIHTQTCKDLFPRITWIRRSKTYRLWVLAGKPLFAGIQGYPKVNPQVIVEKQ